MWTREGWYGGAQYASISADFDLPTRVARVWTLDPQSAGLTVSLPDARRLMPGAHLYLIVNASGTHSFTLRGRNGPVVEVIGPGGHHVAHLLANATEAGLWVGPGGFTPASLGSSLVDWWIPAASYMTKPGGGQPADGEDIDTWTGSVNGVVATATATRRPHWIADVDGLGNPGIGESNGTTALGELTIPAAPPQPFSVAAILKYTAGSSADRPTWRVGTTPRAGVDTAGLHYLYAGNTLAGSAIDASWHYLLWEVAGASSRIRLDGADDVAGDAGSTDGTPTLVIGGLSANRMLGHMRHLIVHGALPGADRTALEAWLAAA